MESRDGQQRSRNGSQAVLKLAGLHLDFDAFWTRWEFLQGPCITDAVFDHDDIDDTTPLSELMNIWYISHTLLP